MSLISIAEKACPRFLRPTFDRVNGSALGRRVASGAFWSVLGGGASRFLTFGSLLLVARILGPEANGEFGFIRTMAMTFVSFSGFGMGLTATKYIAELLHTDRDRAGRIVGLSYLVTLLTSLVVAIAFYVLVPWLCAQKAPHLVGPMRLGAILLFFATISGTQFSVMAGFQDFRGLAIASFLATLVMTPIYILGASLLGLWGAVTGAVVAMVLNLPINSLFIYRHTRRYNIRYSFFEVHKELPVLWKSNVPIVLNAILVSVGMLATQRMLMVQPGGTSQLGIYYVAFYFQQLMLFLPQQVFPVFFPILSELNGSGDKVRFGSLLRKAWLVGTGLSLLVALPFLCFPRWFMGLSGEEYTDGWPVLLGAGLLVVISATNNVVWQLLVSQGRNWLQLGCAILSTSVSVTACYCLFQWQWGAVGLYFGHILGCLAFTLFVLFATVFPWKDTKNHSGKQ